MIRLERAKNFAWYVDPYAQLSQLDPLLEDVATVGGHESVMTRQVVSATKAGGVPTPRSAGPN